MKNLFDQEPYARRGEADARIADLEGAAHPDLADHDALGLATQAELDAHAATSHGGTHPDLAAHDTLGLATQAELDSHAAAADPHPAYETSAEAAAKVTAHEAAADPHTGYLQESVVSGLATPAIALGSAAAAGTGTTPIRHNSTIQAFDATVPNVIEPDDAAAVGVVNFAARRDHEHGIVTAVAGASTFGDAAAEGTATSFARSDHKHSREANPVTAHEAAADPHTGYLQESVISGLATPAIVLGSAAAAGTGTTPIRHNSTIAAFDATAPSTQAFGDAAAVGTVAFAARRDHKHAMPANPVTAHEAAADPHTGYATDTDLTNHAAAADPHTGYQKESEKDVASGYAGLDVNVRVPVARLGSGTPAAATVLRGDGAWTTHDATGDPHSQYATDADLTAHAATAGHTHPNLAAHDTLGLATQAELDAHAAGPHGGGAGHSHDGTGGDTSLIVGGTAEAGASIPVASSTGAIAIGDFATAGTGTQPIAIGSGVNATAAPNATGQGGIAIGASNNTATNGARASGAQAIAIGGGTTGNQLYDAGAAATGSGGIAIGRASMSLGNENVAIGLMARATTSTQTIAIGGGQSQAAAPLANAQGAIAIGASNGAAIAGARASAANAVAIGSGDASLAGASASGAFSVALGLFSAASTTDSFAGGRGSAASGGTRATAVGSYASAGHASATAIGTGAATTAVNQIMLGTAAEKVHVPGVLVPAGSASAPASPVVGQLWLDTDEAPFTAGDAWASYTPVVTQSGTVSFTTVYSRYQRIGRTIIGTVDLNITAAGTAGNWVTVSTPVPAVAVNQVVGMGWVYDASANIAYTGTAELTTVNTIAFRRVDGGVGANFQGSAPFSAALASGDVIRAHFTYEAAS